MLPPEFRPPLCFPSLIELKKKGLRVPQDLHIVKPYSKLPTTYKQQIDLLSNRGLKINQREKLLHLLERINYYRLSGYWHPLLDRNKKEHQFHKSANFETAFLIYRFDRELRLLVVRELEKIEVAVRAQIVHVYSLHHNTGFWHLQPGLFEDAEKYKRCVDEMRETYLKSDAQFIDNFRKCYSDFLPPCWMILELIPFGNLSVFYENLKKTPQKRQVAESFGLDRKTFTSWLHSLAYLRNICAHHARLWNRQLRIPAKKPTNPKNDWLKDTTVSNERAYFAFSMLVYLLRIIDNKNQFIFKLKLLFKKYPNIKPSALGFPFNWQEELLWKKKFTFNQRMKLLFTKRIK